MRQDDAGFDCLVQGEALGGLQFAESFIHRLVHDFADEALVSGPLREALRSCDFQDCFFSYYFHVNTSVNFDNLICFLVVVD